MSTVWWENTARCDYSLVGEYCKLWVQSGGRILQVVSTVWWANTAAGPLLYPAWNSNDNMYIVVLMSVSVQVKILFGIWHRVAQCFGGTYRCYRQGKHFNFITVSRDTKHWPSCSCLGSILFSRLPGTNMAATPRLPATLCNFMRYHVL